MTRKRRPIKGKFYGDDPQELQRFGEKLRKFFNCAVSMPQPSRQGDYHILVSVYEVDA